MVVTQQTRIQEVRMNNLRLYHKLLSQFCQWFPGERITRKRNLAWLVVGLYRSASVHLPHIARQLPLPAQDPSLVNRLRRTWIVRQVSRSSKLKTALKKVIRIEPRPGT